MVNRKGHQRKNNLMYVCDACVIVFQIHSKVSTGKKVYCPICADNADTHIYKVDRIGKTGKHIKIRFSEEEEKLIDKILNDELEAHQVAIMTGRSINSVMQKVGNERRKRRKRDAEKKS